MFVKAMFKAFVVTAGGLVSVMVTVFIAGQGIQRILENMDWGK